MLYNVNQGRLYDHINLIRRTNLTQLLLMSMVYRHIFKRAFSPSRVQMLLIMNTIGSLDLINTIAKV